jgi:hypothetical protein
VTGSKTNRPDHSHISTEMEQPMVTVGIVSDVDVKGFEPLFIHGFTKVHLKIG